MRSITQLKEIVSENPIKQIWKLLHYFHDANYTFRQIKKEHEIINNKQDENIKKQAKQISYCLKQAEEYFNASSVVGLATRPTLIYYGVVSLSQALVLLRGDGGQSLDYLRKKGKQHNNHGLELSKEIKSVQIKEPKEFFSSLTCNLTINESGPIGQFASFYKSLIPPVFCINQSIQSSDKSAFIESSILNDVANLSPIDHFVGKDFNVFELMKDLPDLYSDLLDIGIQSMLSRGNVKRLVRLYYETDSVTGERKNRQTTIIDDFFIDGILPADKLKFIDFYTKKIPDMKIVDDFGFNLYFQLTTDVIKNGVKKDNLHDYYPDIVESVNGKKFYILDPENYLSEPVSYFAITFCLGMLSRYYPDIWLKTINENASVAELSDSILNIVYRKFPNLILDQLTSVKHYLHL